MSPETLAGILAYFLPSNVYFLFFLTFCIMFGCFVDFSGQEAVTGQGTALSKIWGAHGSSHLACRLVLGRGSGGAEAKDSVDGLP